MDKNHEEQTKFKEQVMARFESVTKSINDSWYDAPNASCSAAYVPGGDHDDRGNEGSPSEDGDSDSSSGGSS